MKSPTVLLRSLLLDFSRLEPSVKGLDRDIRTIERRFKHEGYGFLTVTLPVLGDAIVNGISSEQFCCPFGFRKPKGQALPRLFSGLLSEVFDPMSGRVKEQASVSCIQNLIQVCKLFKKVRLDDEDNDKLHSSALDGFSRCDDQIGKTDLSDRDDYLYRLVCSQVLPALRVTKHSLHRDSFDPEFKHGPGAVAESYSPNQKWKGVYEGILTDAFDTERYQYDLFAITPDAHLSRAVGMHVDSSDTLTDRIVKYGTQYTAASRSIARLISVAKDSTSRRTITIEPLLNQFIQQGLNIELRESISKCSILSGCLALSNQGENQKLALIGSLNRRWSTIDLKSASDLLSTKMVSRTFDHLPEFFGQMMNCRSTHVECDKYTLEMRKYAGMGNATTFPVQSIVFALLAITAIVDDGLRKPTHGRVKRASRHVRVYGDDIIVSTKHVHKVVDWLQKAGLTVNQKKSFLDGYFKESCGVDAYRGIDITPIYCRQRPDDSSIDPSAIAGLVSFSNQLWLKGLYKASDTIAREVEGRLGFSLPLVSRNSSALGWHSRTDAMDANSWDSKLQCLTLKARVLTSVKKKDNLDGWPALLKFFHVPLLGRPLKHLQESSMRFRLRIARKRVPTHVG